MRSDICGGVTTYVGEKTTNCQSFSYNLFLFAGNKNDTLTLKFYKNDTRGPNRGSLQFAGRRTQRQQWKANSNYGFRRRRLLGKHPNVFQNGKTYVGQSAHVGRLYHRLPSPGEYFLAF